MHIPETTFAAVDSSLAPVLPPGYDSVSVTHDTSLPLLTDSTPTSANPPKIEAKTVKRPSSTIGIANHNGVVMNATTNHTPPPHSLENLPMVKIPKLEIADQCTGNKYASVFQLFVF